MPAKIALTFIYKDDVNDILPMLESTLPITDFVIAVDTGSTDGTTSLLKRFYKTHNVKLVVLNHEWTFNFATARNVGFKYLQDIPDYKQKFDWIVWFDTDDELLNPEGVRAFIDKFTADGTAVNCLELNYLYMFDDNNNVIVEHFRERFLKTNVSWYWKGAVHEWLDHIDKQSILVLQEFAVKHRRQYLSRPASPDRNLTILLKELETTPTDPRNLIYIGHEYAAMADIDNAKKYYQKYLKCSVWPEERGQVLCKLGTYALNEANYADAHIYFSQALATIPEWPDPYLRMGEYCLKTNDLDNALYWANTALTKNTPQTQLIINPLDYSITPHILKAYTYSMRGDVEEAITEWTTCIHALPNLTQYVGERDKVYQERYRRSIVEAFVRLAAFLTEDEIMHAMQVMPFNVLQDQRVKELTVTAVKSSYAKKTKYTRTVAFFCGVLPYAWSPTTLDTEGLGGTETAVIYVAKWLAAHDWNVIVYGEPGASTGLHDGVLYLPASCFDPKDSLDVFVSVRFPQILPSIPGTTKRILWCHDVSLGPVLTPETDACTDAYMFVSKWQQEQYILAYCLDRLKCAIIHNGIDLSTMERAMLRNKELGVVKNPTKFIWPSSPDRGLDYLLSLWPIINKMVPDSTLDIYYGWDLFVKMHGHDYKNALEALATEVGGDSIKWHGRVGKLDLYKAYAESGVWMYPSRFEETFCISALEAMIFGVYPILNDKGALPSMFGDYAKIIKGHAPKIKTGERFVDAYGEYYDMSNETRHDKLRVAAEYALTYTWDVVSEKVEEVLNNGR